MAGGAGGAGVERRQGVEGGRGVEAVAGGDRRGAATFAPLIVATACLVVVQTLAGVWAASSAAVLGAVAFAAGSVLVPLVLRDGRGALTGYGLSAVGIGQALVVRTATPPSLLVVVLGAWLPAVAIGLALHDAANRAAATALRPLDATAPTATAAANTALPLRAVRSALLADAVIALVAASAAVLLHPPGRNGGLFGSGGDRFSERAARAGRAPTSLGIYQSSDQLDVGRRFSLSNEVVMRVKADAPDFWRGTTYDAWDGRSWARTATDAPSVGDGGESGVVPTAARETFVQVVTVVAGGSDLLFGAYQPVQVLAPERRVSIAPDGTAALTRPLGPGARYTVVSSRPIVSADDLRRADPLASDLPAGVAARYLPLPEVSDRVTDLARDVTAPAPTTYDKIQALEDWMGEHTTYTLDIPPLPDGADAVDQFLFVDRQGYCEQIATSLAVMLRSIGVPARLGVGYAPGSKPWGSDSYEVRGTDAHAWVEVWFPGIGWQAFDPTASVPLSGEHDPGPVRHLLGPLAVAAAVLVAAGVAALLLRRRRIRARRPWERVLLDRLEAAGARRGRPRRPQETFAEYARALGEGVLDADRLDEAAAIVARSSFAPGGVGPDEQRRAEVIVAEAIAAAPDPPRRQAPADELTSAGRGGPLTSGGER